MKELTKIFAESYNELDKLYQLEESIVELSNGKKVGNFSSPHPFTFTDGSVLNAVSKEESERLKVTFIESIVPDGMDGDIELDFELDNSVLFEMSHWQDLFQQDLVNVVFCPLPMITALKQKGYDLINSPFRTVRMASRTDKRVSIDYQCI
jgi:hypothetical protein